jgi:hypothetical protein
MRSFVTFCELLLSNIHQLTLRLFKLANLLAVLFEQVSVY